MVQFVSFACLVLASIFANCIGASECGNEAVYDPTLGACRAHVHRRSVNTEPEIVVGDGDMTLVAGKDRSILIRYGYQV